MTPNLTTAAAATLQVPLNGADVSGASVVDYVQRYSYTGRTSHVTRHTSHVTRHVHVTHTSSPPLPLLPQTSLELSWKVLRACVHVSCV